MTKWSEPGSPARPSARLAASPPTGGVRVEAWHTGLEPGEVAARVAAAPSPSILESVAGDPAAGHWSIFACDPVEVLAVGAKDIAGGRDALARLEERWARYPAVAGVAELPFSGGWIGFLGYEAGVALEGVVPSNPPGLPLPRLRMGLYDSAALYDHRQSCWYLVAVDWPRDTVPGRPSVEERLVRLRRRLEQVPPPARPGRGMAQSPRAELTRATYLARVRRAQDYIAAGDVYEVNLSQRFVARTAGPAEQLYQTLRRANPADYAAYLAWDNTAVLSASPELFLDLRGGRVLTRPIKGTCPRTGDEHVDAARREELCRSPKERAELNMIIDLLRNDLSRVCVPGSVRVLSDGALEAHPTVFHRVAGITGELAGGGALGLLRAAFPGGSITGAPKIRAMQIIDELESVQRGVYCGAIGYLGLDGDMMMNIAIRTLVWHRGAVELYAGGAIVADSDPAAEYAETLAKAEGLLRALGAGASCRSAGLAGGV